MSRLDGLKKQYPELNVTIFDMLLNLDPTKSYKYMPLFCKLFGERFDVKKQISHSEYRERVNDLVNSLKSRGINSDGLTDNQVYAYYSLGDFYTNSLYETLSEFMDYMERGKIENKDVTSYKSVDEMRSAITLASIKELNQELAGQVIKEFEDDTWVILRPLTFASSAKYGAGTRWCTTYQKEKSYFEKYWRTGVLVYFINKKTGYKFAGFRDLSSRELSFWNAEDQRVDYLDIYVDDYLYPTVVKIFKSTDTNKNLCTAEIQEQVHNECIEEYRKMRVAVPDEEPTLANEYEYRVHEPTQQEVSLQEVLNLYVQDETPQPIFEQPNIA